MAGAPEQLEGCPSAVPSLPDWTSSPLPTERYPDNGENEAPGGTAPEAVPAVRRAGRSEVGIETKCDAC